MNVIRHSARGEQGAFFLAKDSANVGIKTALQFSLNERRAMFRREHDVNRQRNVRLRHKHLQSNVSRCKYQPRSGDSQ